MEKMKINGESGDMHGETVESWKERLPKLLQGYSKENIWNIDETACFGGLSQIMVLAREDHSAKEVKKQSSKLQLPYLRERKKHLLSFGNLRVQNASRE